MTDSLTEPLPPNGLVTPVGFSPSIGPELAGSQLASSPAPVVAQVLHLINGEHFSGAERVQDLLSARLPEYGFPVGLVAVKPGKYRGARRHQQAPLFDAPMKSKFDLSVARQVIQIVRDGGYSMIHAHTPRSGLVARVAAAWCRLPFVYHVHSPTSRDTTHRWRNVANHWTERLCLVGATALVTVSDSLRRHMLVQGFAASRVTTVPNGVPVPNVLRGDRPPAGDWTLGVMALFRPRKGLEVLLDALAMLRQQGLPVKLRAVGPFETPDYAAAIHARASRLGIEGAIEWTGFCTDIGEQLGLMDLFVLPSLFGEGLPMVVLEAMAAGVPVVATRVEGVPEAVEHGVHGLLAEPGDPAALAGAIREVVTGRHNWLALRECARARQAAQFSDHSMASALAAVYRRILAR